VLKSQEYQGFLTFVIPSSFIIFCPGFSMVLVKFLSLVSLDIPHLKRTKANPLVVQRKGQLDQGYF
jgi:hypothetical protein